MPSARRTGGAGRVIAGSARGRRLLSPGDGTRPLGDRVKQTLFAILEPVIRDRWFLDLYAASGAGGIEALSRGAAGAVFVDRSRDAVQVIEANLVATGLAGAAARVVRDDVSRWLRDPPPIAFGAILADPPYDRPEELVAVLDGVAAAGRDGLLAGDGILVVKHFWKTALPGNRLLRSVRVERFGETMLTFQRWSEGQQA
jgi:16S rRNA (guanine(966)-N(2))-methyltransferase RsmD